mmetsp:Transcript_21613/g.62008  ORF Transcript_21613/g.62008 Transcript_21613/m.62008 type:complete len:203 (-) Transcript_21613:97-705(-)
MFFPSGLPAWLVIKKDFVSDRNVTSGVYFQYKSPSMPLTQLLIRKLEPLFGLWRPIFWPPVSCICPMLTAALSLRFGSSTAVIHDYCGSGRTQQDGRFIVTEAIVHEHLFSNGVVFLHCKPTRFWVLNEGPFHYLASLRVDGAIVQVEGFLIANVNESRRYDHFALCNVLSCKCTQSRLWYCAFAHLEATVEAFAILNNPID